MLYLPPYRITDLLQPTLRNKALKDLYLHVFDSQITKKDTRTVLQEDSQIKQVITDYFCIDNFAVHEAFSSPVGSRKLLTLKLNYIKFLNSSIHEVVQHFNIPGIFSSHSFRIGRINGLLEQFSLVDVAHFIGHKSIKSTEIYTRANNSPEKLAKLEYVGTLFF